MSTIITDNPYTFTVADNMNINAVFENDTCRINAYIYYTDTTTQAGGVDTSSFNNPKTTSTYATTGSGNYNIGDSCTVVANIQSGREPFIGWYDLETGVKLSTSKSYTFTVSKSQDLYALLGYTTTGNGAGVISFSENRSCTYSLTGTDVYGNATTQSASCTYSSGGGTKANFTNLPKIPDVMYLDFNSVSDNNTAATFRNTTLFNLIHNEDHPLNTRGIFAFNDYNSTLRTNIRGWFFGPREGSTIYLSSEYPFTNSKSSYKTTPQQLSFTQHTAPNFNIKLNCNNLISESLPLSWLYVPKDGVGYDNDWIDANFTYTTRPTIVKVRFR